MGRDLENVREGTMWISGEQCHRQRDRGSKNCVETGAHLMCSRNRKEAHVAQAQKAERVADQFREAMGVISHWKDLRFYSKQDEDLENSEKNGEELHDWS